MILFYQYEEQKNLHQENIMIVGGEFFFIIEHWVISVCVCHYFFTYKFGANSNHSKTRRKSAETPSFLWPKCRSLKNRGSLGSKKKCVRSI